MIASILKNFTKRSNAKVEVSLIARPVFILIHEPRHVLCHLAQARNVVVRSGEQHAPSWRAC